MTDRITMETPDGIAEAIRVEAGKWHIGYPTGDDWFFGSATEVQALMKRRIAADYPQ